MQSTGIGAATPRVGVVAHYHEITYCKRPLCGELAPLHCLKRSSPVGGFRWGEVGTVSEDRTKVLVEALLFIIVLECRRIFISGRDVVEKDKSKDARTHLWNS